MELGGFMSIYKGTTQLAGGFTEVDGELSSVSTNPPQNKIVTERLAAFAPYIQYYGVSQMNTQETVNAADLLAATGDLHALNLDLSQNTVLKKLTAAGTSGSLANLSGVLVSPFAPLDSATSPQIDLSYSALNKTALVNLFNSMPYNVGYTVVGSPTITNGIVSNFSQNDYLSINSSINIKNITETLFKLYIDTSIIGDNQNFSLLQDGTRVQYFFNKYLTYGVNMTIYVAGAGHTSTSRNIPTDTWFYLKTTYNGTTYKAFKSLDKITWEQIISFDVDLSSQTDSTSFRIGSNPYQSVNYFEGSIDLNETYIQKNNVPWFTGQASATKTCDVRDCIGTDDLTQDDKDIVLNKGWSLTVA